MRISGQTYGLGKIWRLVSAIVLLTVCLAAAASDTNEIPQDFRGPFCAWGEKTNECRAGLTWNEAVRDEAKIQEAEVMVWTSQTDVTWDFVKPPSGKFARFELRDQNGVLLAPERGKELSGELPQTILTKDLPMTPRFGRNNSLPAGELFLGPNFPKVLKNFIIQDTYPIKAAGDLTLTAWPAIYQFSTNRQFLVRIDLLPVSIKIHLTPTPD